MRDTLIEAAHFDWSGISAEPSPKTSRTSPATGAEAGGSEAVCVLAAAGGAAGASAGWAGAAGAGAGAAAAGAGGAGGVASAG